MTGNALAMTAELAASLATPPDTRDFDIRCHHLKQMARSAAHCRHSILDNREPLKLPALPKQIGSGVHSVILGGPPVLLYPGRQRRGADYEAWRKAQPADALVYTRGDYERVQAIANAVKSDRLAAQVLYAPEMLYEQTIRWEWMGRKRRCTPDARNFSVLIDLKTTRNASPEKFRWDVIRFGYHAQMADYRRAIEVHEGRAPREVMIVAVETTEPYPVVVYRLTPNDLEQGDRLIRSWFERLLLCEATNDWPGYAETTVDLDLPDPDGDATFPMDVDDIEPSDIDLSAEE